MRRGNLANAEKIDQKAIDEIKSHGGTVSEPTPELHKFMVEAGHRSWSLFTDPKSSNYVPTLRKFLTALPATLSNA